jgi:hypothetical protein
MINHHHHHFLLVFFVLICFVVEEFCLPWPALLACAEKMSVNEDCFNPGFTARHRARVL